MTIYPLPARYLAPVGEGVHIVVEAEDFVISAEVYAGKVELVGPYFDTKGVDVAVTSFPNPTDALAYALGANQWAPEPV